MGAMSDATSLKTLVEFVAEVAMWRQKASDLEKERDWLRERIAALEQAAGGSAATK